MVDAHDLDRGLAPGPLTGELFPDPAIPKLAHYMAVKMGAIRESQKIEQLEFYRGLMAVATEYVGVVRAADREAN